MTGKKAVVTTLPGFVHLDPLLHADGYVPVFWRLRETFANHIGPTIA